MEEMKEQPVSPSDVVGRTGEGRSTATAGCRDSKVFCYYGNICNFLFLNQSNIYSTGERSQAGQMALTAKSQKEAISKYNYRE